MSDTTATSKPTAPKTTRQRAKGRPGMNKHGMRINPGTTRRVIGYMMHYRWRLALVALCIIVGAAAQAGASLFLQRLIDDYILPLIGAPDPNWAPLLRALTLMAALYLSGIVCTYVYSRLLVTVEQGTLKTIRDDMFGHMQKLPLRYFDSTPHGDIMSRYTNDADTLRQAISQSLPQMFNSLISSLAALIAMMVLSLPLTGIVVVFSVALFAFVRVLTTRSGRFFGEQQHELADVNAFVEESISGQKVIKVFTHEAATQKDFDKRNASLYEATRNANYYGNILMPIVNNMGYLLYVLLAVIGAALAIGGAGNVSLTGAGAYTTGTIVSFLTLSRSFVNPLGEVSQQMTSVLMALAGASRIFELLDEKPEVNDGRVTIVNASVLDDGTIREADHRTDQWAWKVPAGVRVRADIARMSPVGAGDGATGAGDGGKIVDTANADRTQSAPAAKGTVVVTPAATLVRQRGDIRLNHVNFSYEPGHEVLHDITLFAKPGQKVALVGATGAGKTTITNLINRFYDIDDGEILYDGINVKDMDKTDLRRSLGIVLQDVNLFTGTVMDNIRYGNLEASDEDCIRAAKLANADGFIRMLPHGYRTRISGSGDGLSQGQRQLISIARAAVADPPAMILDEATSSIDTRTEEIVQSGMDALMEGRTVFVIAHRLSTVRNADVIMVMDHGRIIERGNHDELIAQRGQYYQLYTGAFELE
ncbi:ABC transporter ATP-binding protein [Pseudoscardovia radai]|uniref:ABC transporter ATP-binding protein n=1 Tax=Pseudoscardovia radai TaxID=987066 RepID=UPI003992D6CF